MHNERESPNTNPRKSYCEKIRHINCAEIRGKTEVTLSPRSRAQPRHEELQGEEELGPLKDEREIFCPGSKAGWQAEGSEWIMLHALRFVT